MKSINLYGVSVQSRREISSTDHIQESEVTDVGRLTSIIRDLSRRITALEAELPSSSTQPVEFEVNVGNAGAVTTLQHNFNSAVRYYVVQWGRQVNSSGVPQSAPTNPCTLVVDPTSDKNNLKLKSYVSGKAVIRVEPSKAATFG